MSNPQFASLKLATASPSLLASSLPQPSLPLSSYSGPSTPAGVPVAPKAEWAAEAIVNSRHVVAGISYALIIEGAVALSVYAAIATWSLWHLR